MHKARTLRSRQLDERGFGHVFGPLVRQPLLPASALHTFLYVTSSSIACSTDIIQAPARRDARVDCLLPVGLFPICFWNTVRLDPIASLIHPPRRWECSFPRRTTPLIHSFVCASSRKTSALLLSMSKKRLRPSTKVEQAICFLFARACKCVAFSSLESYRNMSHLPCRAAWLWKTKMRTRTLKNERTAGPNVVSLIRLRFLTLFIRTRIWKRWLRRWPG